MSFQLSRNTVNIFRAIITASAVAALINSLSFEIGYYYSNNKWNDLNFFIFAFLFVIVIWFVGFCSFGLLAIYALKNFKINSSYIYIITGAIFPLIPSAYEAVLHHENFSFIYHSDPLIFFVLPGAVSGWIIWRICLPWT